MGGKRPQIAIRIQALALIEEGVPIRRVMEATGMAKSSIFRLRKTARERGYDPDESRQLKEEYVDDATRSGRPRSMTEEQRQSVVQRVREQREGKWAGDEAAPPLTHKKLSQEFNVSKVTIRRLLRVSGIESLQPPPKPKPAPVEGAPAQDPSQQQHQQQQHQLQQQLQMQQHQLDQQPEQQLQQTLEGQHMQHVHAQPQQLLPPEQQLQEQHLQQLQQLPPPPPPQPATS
jgi:hypothetical protein